MAAGLPDEGLAVAPGESDLTTVPSVQAEELKDQPHPLYDQWGVAEIVAWLNEQNPAMLRQVAEYEQRNRNRQTILKAVTKRLPSEG